MVFVGQNKNASVEEACDEGILVACIKPIALKDAQRQLKQLSDCVKGCGIIILHCTAVYSLNKRTAALYMCQALPAPHPR